MRIISSVDGGVVRGVGAGGTKGSGLVSIKRPLTANVGAGGTAVHATELRDDLDVTQSPKGAFLQLLGSGDYVLPVTF